jgi:predicted nucleotidyltransferase
LVDHRVTSSYAAVVTLPAALSASEVAAIRAFVDAARALLSPELLEARLFGSRARGEGHELSDIDIALVVAPGGGGRVAA